MCTSDVKKSPKKSKETVRGGERKSTKGKQRPEYKRRVKAPYSYVQLITMAIRSSLSKMKTLREILDYMQAKFPCFRGSYVGWKNSVRHNLSAAECFTKVLRNTERPYGKDNYWTMNLACSHCFTMKSGGPAQNRRMSYKTARTASASSDHGFHTQDYTVHNWVANQATITMVPSSSSSEPDVQYIELCHTNRSEQRNRDIAKLDFESSINRIEPGTWKTSFQSSSRAPSSSSTCDSWTSENSRFDSRPSTSRVSPSSIAESWTTRSSGFESSSDTFDLYLAPAADNLDTIMDDLFDPEDDIDLSLYGELSETGNHDNQMNNGFIKTEDDKSYIAEGSPNSSWSPQHPPSPYSTGSVTSEIRTSITPRPSTPFPFAVTRTSPPSPQQSYSHPSSPYFTCSATSESQTGTHLQPQPYDYIKQELAHQQSHHQSSPFCPQCQNYVPPVTCVSRSDDELCANMTMASLPSTLHSPKMLPTFESMLTNTVRDSLNLDFESVGESFSA